MKLYIYSYIVIVNDACSCMGETRQLNGGERGGSLTLQGSCVFEH